MTGVPRPEMGAVHSGFAGSIDVGGEGSSEVPFWCGPRHESQSSLRGPDHSNEGVSSLAAAAAGWLARGFSEAARTDGCRSASVRTPDSRVPHALSASASTRPESEVFMRLVVYRWA